jgi:hypothetical protein
MQNVSWLTRYECFRAATGEQSGCAVSSDTIDQLMEQIIRERAAMQDEIARLRRQFAIDL